MGVLKKLRGERNSMKFGVYQNLEVNSLPFWGVQENFRDEESFFEN